MRTVSKEEYKEKIIKVPAAMQNVIASFRKGPEEADRAIQEFTAVCNDVRFMYEDIKDGIYDNS